MITFRTLSKDEYPTALKLWVEVFGVEADFFQSLLDGDAPDAFSVGAFDGDRIVSSVHVFVRWFRDRNGKPQKVGSIGSVSTDPAYRAQGLSSKLLQMAIEGMAKIDCIWSYLGTGVNDHYAKQGWRTVSTPLFKGKLASFPNAAPIEPAEVTDILLEQMEKVHRAYTRTQPMSNARSPGMWQTAILFRITGQNDEVFAAYRDDNVSAYLVTRRWETHLQVVEGACLPEHASDLAELTRMRLEHASNQGVVTVDLTVAEETECFVPFVGACKSFYPAEDRAWMVRPIANQITWADLVSIHADPRGRRSDLDNF